MVNRLLAVQATSCQKSHLKLDVEVEEKVSQKKKLGYIG